MPQESLSQPSKTPPPGQPGPCLLSRPRARLGSAGPRPSDCSGCMDGGSAGCSGLGGLRPGGEGGRAGGATPQGAEAWTGSPSCASSPHSARRNTHCCALTSLAGASAPGAPSASCCTAARSASAGGRPQSQVVHLPGPRPPPATEPGDGDSGGCVRQLGGGVLKQFLPALGDMQDLSGEPLYPFAALKSSDPKRNLSSKLGIKLRTSLAQTGLCGPAWSLPHRGRWGLLSYPTRTPRKGKILGEARGWGHVVLTCPVSGLSGR